MALAVIAAAAISARATRAAEQLNLFAWSEYVPQAVIDGFFTADSLLEACRALEKDGMSVRADMAAMKVQLTKRTDALGRARKRIEELERALAEAAQDRAAGESAETASA